MFILYEFVVYILIQIYPVHTLAIHIIFNDVFPYRYHLLFNLWNIFQLSAHKHFHYSIIFRPRNVLFEELSLLLPLSLLFSLLDKATGNTFQQNIFFTNKRFTHIQQ